jgi:hypothetical protein
MKLYIKDNKIYKRNQISIVKDGMRTFNPTEEMLLADGWVEYTTPIEPESLEKEINLKIKEVLNYDSSAMVNIFYVFDMPMWLDKATRAGLLLRFQAEQENGEPMTTLWYEGKSFQLKVDQAIRMLYAIEMYASACYDNTQKHIGEIKKLDNIEDVKNYDYTSGYPKKLRF